MVGTLEKDGCSSDPAEVLIKPDVNLDLNGKVCPMPAAETRKAIKLMDVGKIIEIIKDAEAGSKFAVGTEINLVKRLANLYVDKEIYPLSAPCLLLQAGFLEQLQLPPVSPESPNHFSYKFFP